jgi:hypothetical protein
VGNKNIIKNIVMINDERGERNKYSGYLPQTEGQLAVIFHSKIQMCYACAFRKEAVMVSQEEKEKLC